MIPRWLNPLISFFGWLAWVGLVLSLLSHLAALAGVSKPLGNYTFALHIGLFIVWLPAVLVASRIGREFKQKDLWKGLLRGCPPWMKYMAYGFFGYAFLNFAIFLLSGSATSRSGPMTPAVVRGFSGHWMAFYSMAGAILYSATHIEDRDRGRRCVNGHTVGPFAKFCEECGQSVIEGS